MAVTPLKKLHTEFLEDLEIGQGRSSKTVQNYDHYLQRFYNQQKITSLSDITLDAVREFRRHLSEVFEVSLPTQNYHLIALRQLLKYLAKRDIKALSAEKIGLAKLPDRDIDVLYPEEVDTLLTAAQPQYANNKSPLASLRDCALLSTLVSTGLRVSECVQLNRDEVRTSGEIPVRGKGNKVRVVFLSQPAQAAIAAYLEKRHDLDPALFIRHGRPQTSDQYPSEDSSSRRLTPRTVQRLIKKYAALAGLTKTVTPHTLRHSFATDLLANGADVRQVQQLLGHSSITTTQVYTHLTDVHLKEIHQKYHRTKSQE